MECKLALLFLVLAQAASSAPLEPTALAVAPPCEAQRSVDGEIVVCAPRPEGLSPYRITQLPARQAGIPKAQVRLAKGVIASAETEQAMVGGFPSNRAVIRIKFKF